MQEGPVSVSAFTLQHNEVRLSFTSHLFISGGCYSAGDGWKRCWPRSTWRSCLQQVGVSDSPGDVQGTFRFTSSQNRLERLERCWQV